MLKAFYQAYAAWLDAGAPHLEPFSRGVGLCNNLRHFTDDWKPLRTEMAAQFEAAGLDPKYPFGGEADYDERLIDERQHMNPERIEWVRNHANS